VSIEPDVQAALIKGKDQLFAEHGRDRNFTGCGVGFRRRAGKVTEEPVIIAFVEHKLPAGAVSRRLLLPETVEVDGVSYGVDIVEAGPVYASSGSGKIAPDVIEDTGPIDGVYRPLVQGCSIQNINADESNFGTLGCFVIDTTDNTVCLLSANHVIAMDSEATPGQEIIQPAVADSGTSDYGVATFKRAATISDVDAAIAQLDTQSSSAWQATFADDLMEPISTSHPAVGMCVASDSSFNSFLSRMDSTLSELGVTIAGVPSGSTGTAAPVVGTNIEKVGRTSGYTSSTVDAIAVTVTVDFGDDIISAMQNMIWSQWFHLAADSGAIACQGGPGDIYVLPALGECEILGSVESYYDIPATNGNAITNAAQDDFLSQSLSGLLAINLIYMNGQVVIDRLASDTGTAYNQATAQAYASEFYDKYYDVIVNALQDPDSTDPVLTDDMITDYYTFWTFLTTAPASGGAGGIITDNEADSAYTLMIILGDAVGMTFQELIAYFNQESIYNTLYQLAVYTGTLETP
jgi:hypothetical protein